MNNPRIATPNKPGTPMTHSRPRDTLSTMPSTGFYFCLMTRSQCLQCLHVTMPPKQSTSRTIGSAQRAPPIARPFRSRKYGGKRDSSLRRRHKRLRRSQEVDCWGEVLVIWDIYIYFFSESFHIYDYWSVTFTKLLLISSATSIPTWNYA